MDQNNSSHTNWHSITRDQIVAHAGMGKIEYARLFSNEDFQTNTHFVDFAVIPPGSSIGNHRHSSSEELYFILSGTGQMHVNSIQFRVCTGDIILNPLNGVHGLLNDGTVNIEMLVIEIGQSKLPETHVA